MSDRHIDIHSHLIEGCKKGDGAAQRALYSLYAHAMYNTAYRIVKSEEDASDVLQESFLQMFLQIDSYRGEASFGAWFKRIVVNKALNHLRSAKLPLLSLDSLAEAPLVEGPEMERPFDFTVDDVKRVLTTLSDGYQLIFGLYMFEGYTHQEIADELGISLATSKSQLSRAKARLREQLISKK